MIIITGGHLTPALSLIDELHRRHFTDIVFIGRQISGDEAHLPAQEARLITAKGIQFIPLTTGKLYRHFSLKAIISLLKIPLGLFKSWLTLRQLKPQLVVSFGGYLALPVCIAAKVLAIPIITHEQGTRVGLANRLIGLMARKIAISWPVNRLAFPIKKTVLTGNPLRSAILDHRTKSLIPGPINRPLLYVTGGNQGSRIINQTLLSLLPTLTQRYLIIHQTGLGDFAQFNRLQLPYYFPFAWLEDTQVAWCLFHAALVISRSGANTVTELAFTGTPAILIPLPRAQQNEQWHNANLLNAAGTAQVILQTELTPTRLEQEINFVLSHLDQFKRHGRAARKLINPRATRILTDLIYGLLKN